MQNKYEKYYNTIIEYRKKHPIITGYFETHHIQPKSLGGLDNKQNLIDLTGREHFIAHLLLKKIMQIRYGINSPEYKSMTYALWQMANTRLQKHITSRQYEWLRIEFSRMQHDRFLGSNNPRFGKEVKQSARDKISKANKGKLTWMKGKSHTEEAKAQMIEHHADVAGENNPMYGKKHSIESIQKMKEHQWDRSGSKNPRFGKKLTDKEKQHLSKILSGKNHPMYGKTRPEHSKKMSGPNNPSFGKKWMFNPLTNEKVYSKNDDIQKYLNNGFVFGTGRKQMNDPKFKEAFGGGQFDPAKFADAFKNGGSASGATNPDGSVDAKFE